MEESRNSKLEEFNKTNIAKISGIFSKNLEYSHTCHNEEFFSSIVSVARKSGTIDHIPIVVSADFITDYKVEGKIAYITGSVRSRGVEGDDGKIHLKVFVFVDKLHICEEEQEIYGGMNQNSIFLDAQVCKQPVLRRTYSGKAICDFIVKKRFCNNYYIPTIAWGRTAHKVSELDYNDKIAFEARFQSRYYTKNGERKETFELSIFQLL